MSELLALSPSPSNPITQPPPNALPNTATMHAKLVKADFHGSLVTVRQSKNPCLVGLSGLVIHETENAFKIVTRKDQLKLIPKKNSIFVFAVPLYSTSPPSLPPTQVTAAMAATPEDAVTTPSEAVRTVLDLPHIEFELYGTQFCFRAAERVGRKFKHKETIEL
ncbi:uncharacterized protein FIBRA_01156 [Fibroporia radiculosa]|uniref:Uncharacterized protein n=1 Tax=Fibroporia radiculosa TaxID=599839 RepID=J4I8B9_9APHY|nr:uncharacterized protein FIBRA_01156 [Fibroporia radiculosa]CCL99141.1 predicted protein [Fibroporia radiculosa]